MGAGVLANDQRPTTNNRFMDIADWRRTIDDVDRKLVELLSQRAQAVHEIGKLKAGAGLPVYEPDREKIVFENARKANGGPGRNASERNGNGKEAAFRRRVGRYGN